MTTWSEETKQRIKQNLILCLMLTIFVDYLAIRVGALCTPGNKLLQQIGNVLSNGTLINEIVNNPLGISFGGAAPICFLVCTFIMLLVTLVLFTQAITSPERVGQEHGSASWATLKEIRKFASNLKTKYIKREGKKDIEYSPNMIFSNNVKLAVKRKGYDKLHDRNLNVAIIGGSGSGKTRNYVKPNLMELHGNYFVTDPKGTLIKETGHLFEKNDYKIKCINLIPETMNESMGYNPLYYVKTKEQIQAFIFNLIKNTTPPKSSTNDPFWEKSETLLYTAILSYMQDWWELKDFTIPGMLEMLNLAEVKENDENFVSNLDKIFKEIETGYMCISPSDDKESKEMIEYYMRHSKLVNKTQPVSSFERYDNETFIGAGINPYCVGDEVDIPSNNVNQRTGKSYWDIFTEFGVEPKEDVLPKTLRRIADKWGNPNKKGKPVSKMNNYEKEQIGKLYVWPSTESWQANRNDYLCVLAYNHFKAAAGETMKSIIISCFSRLAPIEESPELSRILRGKQAWKIDPKTGSKYLTHTGECELEIDNLGGISKAEPHNKMIIYAIMSDTNTTYNFIFALLMFQTLDVLCTKANTEFDGPLPTFVDMELDEFANIGNIKDFDHTISITRSRNIGINMILQAFSQLQNNYSKEASSAILENCDTTVYLGGGTNGAELSTCKEISTRLGEQTIRVNNYGQTKSSQGSSSINRQVQKRELMTAEEVMRMSRLKEIVMIKGFKPYIDDKYMLEKHPNYRYIDPTHENMGLDAENKEICAIFDFIAYKEKLQNNEFKDQEKNSISADEFAKLEKETINKNKETLKKQPKSDKEKLQVEERKKQELRKRGISPELYNFKYGLSELAFINIKLTGSVNASNTKIKELSVLDCDGKLVGNYKINDNSSDKEKIIDFLKTKIIVSYGGSYIKKFLFLEGFTTTTSQFLPLVKIFAPIYGKKTKIYGNYKWPNFYEFKQYYNSKTNDSLNSENEKECYCLYENFLKMKGENLDPKINDVFKNVGNEKKEQLRKRSIKDNLNIINKLIKK